MYDERTSDLTQLLSGAIMLATSAHAGQFDKAGQPYILHPLRVMLSLTAPAARVVGVLHDVLEDCPDYRAQTWNLLSGHPGIWKALRGVSKHEFGPETYREFILRCYSAGPLARQVKLADLADNSDRKRAVSEDIVQMIADRYVWASTYVATGDMALAEDRKRLAQTSWREHGEHPFKLVYTPELAAIYRANRGLSA